MGVLRDLAAYGCLGLLVEVWFTGAASLIRRDPRLVSTTYLWMFPIYGIGGLVLATINHALSGYHILVRGIPTTICIYLIEFTSGYALQKFVGRCPWLYVDKSGKIHRFSILGLVRIDYAPFWYLLAVFFDCFDKYIVSTINHISRL